MNCFVNKLLDAACVENIDTDLSSGGINASKVLKLKENENLSFIGVQKSGPFDISGELARQWISEDARNAEVLRPFVNGNDLVRRYSDRWIIDFGCYMSLEEASTYKILFEYVKKHVKPFREKCNRKNHKDKWWIHGESRHGMKNAINDKFWLFYRTGVACKKEIKSLNRYIITPRVSKFRVFRFVNSNIVPDCRNVVISKNDFTTLGILSSKINEMWSLKLGNSLGTTPAYTPRKTLETFPFPEGLTLDIPAAQYAKDPRAMKIAAIAKELNETRESWLNPPELVKIVPDILPCYPDRILPIDEKAASILKKRTLTNLYNENPDWLRDIHNRLDIEVAKAYGINPKATDAEILQFLFKLNQERANDQ